MLSQHHPEYVSLAWGTMKFLFIVSIPSRLEANGNENLSFFYSLS